MEFGHEGKYKKIESDYNMTFFKPVVEKRRMHPLMKTALLCIAFEVALVWAIVANAQTATVSVGITTEAPATTDVCLCKEIDGKIICQC